MHRSMQTIPSDVFIIDEDASNRKALEVLLHDEGLRVQTFHSAEEFLDSREDPCHGCLILDVELPGLNGLQLQRLLKNERCSVAVVFVTSCGDIPSSVQAIKNGAIDFLTRPLDHDALVTAVNSAIRASHRSQLFNAKMDELRSRYDLLTPRERMVFPLIAAGFANKNVGFELGISEITVKAHRGNLMRKMNASSLAELIRMAMKLDILGGGRARESYVGRMPAYA